MQILGCFSLLVVFCSVLGFCKEILPAFLELFLMDSTSRLKVLTQNNEFKGVSFVCRFFSPVFSLLWVFLMLCLGLRFLKFSLCGKGLIQFLFGVRGKSRGSKKGFCSELDFSGVYDSKIVSCKVFPWKSMDESEARIADDSFVNKDAENSSDDGVCGEDDGERESSVEDEEFDVVALRKLVKIERLRADMTYTELEKERMASASAADEAMAMILRLQNAKSSTEIEAKQYRKLAEQKQEFYEEAIESLQWDITKLEFERSELNEHLRMYREMLKQYTKTDEVDHLKGLVQL